MRAPPFIVPNILLNQSVSFVQHSICNFLQVYVNGTATFHCKVVSDLIPHIMWVKVDRGEDGKIFYYNETAKETMFKYIEMDTIAVTNY